MISLLFNPFETNLEDLQPAELGKLRTIAEGWYIEYKGSAVSPKNIAKSLAAFANHYGGWVFYGIEEAGDGSHCAGSFPGLDQQNASTLINDIKNAAKDIVTPSPYYEYRKLDGPCAEIGLPNEKSIVVVGVPVGPDSPYIHNDGRIYRRIADSSDPKPETDKIVLDNLWNRRQQTREKLYAFLETTPTLSKGEENLTYIDLFLLPDPLGYANQSVKLKFSNFVEYLSKPPTSEPTLYAKFDNFFSMADGVIARQIYDNNSYNLTLTWKFYRNGFSKISIPLSSSPAIYAERWLNGYNQKSNFKKLLGQGEFDSRYILDINPLFTTILAIVRQNRFLLAKSGIIGPYFAKAALHNIWRRTPFVDTELFIDFVQKHGIPLIQFEDEFSPAGKTFETLIQLQDIKSIDDEDSTKIMVEDAIKILLPIFNGLGLPAVALFEEETEKAENSLLDTANRAVEVTKQRRKLQNSNYKTPVV